MRIEYKGNMLNETEKSQIWEILCQCDEDFYPPLSARNSSSQKQLKGADGSSMKKNGEPIVYYEEMIRQNFVLAYADDGKVVGFMTFKKDYICEALENFGTSLYITTICVRSECRGQHIMDALYHHMENEVTRECGCEKVSTRTWSLNTAHLHELSRRGYDVVAVLKDDRGEGVDTVYFGFRCVRG
ncbi:MAG: GNAT family N-acetyltransferase [Clostridiales bacterium]|nr:GNAT family N-acetyltransferase [Clostridiales bacterium]